MNKKIVWLALPLAAAIALMVWITNREESVDITTSPPPAAETTAPSQSQTGEAPASISSVPSVESDQSDLSDGSDPGRAVAPAELAATAETTPPEPKSAIEQFPDLRPGFMASDNSVVISSPTEDTLNALAAEIRANAGPDALDEAASLLHSDRPGLPLVGAKLLLREDGWTEAIFNQVNQHADLSVPLYLWQGLMEAGRIDDANALADNLVRRVGGMTDWIAFTGSRALPGTAVRGLIHVSEHMLEPAALNELLQSVVHNEENDYSARMRALLEYQHTLPFTEYRDKVYEELARETENNDPVWAEGLQRLARDLEGPVPVLSAPKVIVPGDIDMMVAHEYPATLEDIALTMEMALKREDSTFAPGVIERIDQLIADRSRGPLDESEKIALQRLTNIKEAIVEAETRAASLQTPPVGW